MSLARHPFVHEAFSSRAAESPAAIAIDAGDGRLVSYGDLQRFASGIAVSLAAAGIAPADPVVIYAADRVEIVASMIGVLEAGCAFVPLTPDLPPARAARMLAASHATAALVGAGAARDFAAALESAAREVIAIPIELRKADLHPPRTTRGSDDFCYIFFTSGSTGEPKPIAGRLNAIDHFVRWEIAEMGISAGSRVSQLIHPTFDAVLRDVFVPLCAGGTSCVPGQDALLDGERLLQWLEQSEIELVHCVPTLFRVLLPHIDSGQRLPRLRHVLLSGEPLTPADVAAWTSHFGTRIQLTNLYGPSETTMTKFVYRVTARDARRRSIPIGQPMPGVAALLLDDDGQVCAPRRVGEIYIR
ncbi:MAG TPA: AMP-binding protein, partial [Gemmatimonadaceae bacterium]